MDLNVRNSHPSPHLNQSVGLLQQPRPSSSHAPHQHQPNHFFNDYTMNNSMTVDGNFANTTSNGMAININGGNATPAS